MKSSSDTPSAPLSFGQRIFAFCVALLAFGLALLIFKFPLDHWYNASGGYRARLVVYAIELFWGPIGIILSIGFGLLMFMVTFSKDRETVSRDPKKPQSAQSLEKRSTPRNAVTALMPRGATQLTTAALQKALKQLDPSATSSAEIIELPDGSTEKRLARARFGNHVVRLTGLNTPISQAVQLETIYHSSFPSALLAPMYDHGAQIGLQYERGTDDPALQMEALHIVACALLDAGLLGIVDERACNAVPRAYFERAMKNRTGLDYASGLPSEVCTGTVQHVQSDASVWFASRGFERFGAPNFAVKGDANHAALAHEFFNKMLNYIYVYKAGVEAGHTSDLGGHFVRFYEPAANEAFLRYGNHETLVIAIEDEQAVPLEPPARSTSAPSLEPRNLPTAVSFSVERTMGTGDLVSMQLFLTRVSAAHVPLTAAESQWMRGHIDLAVGLMLSLIGKKDTKQTTNLNDIYDLVKAIDVLKIRGFSPEQERQLSLEFGLLFGELIAAKYDFKWSRPSSESFVIQYGTTAMDVMPLVHDVLKNSAFPAHSLIPVFFWAGDLKEIPEVVPHSTVSKGEDVPGFQLGLKS